MSIAATSMSEVPLSGATRIPRKLSLDAAPRRRRTVARADPQAEPEAR